ncbi:hypothetical protein OG243_33265 [Streptomyces sp. NBC_01318]|uniref:hypothetical protein n=1 Tax=Streptomyces sp. NBC_01318 TaxID=2903823 RepID=UPI002E14D976|nr:hypothetical protein OG243_33265 [Streptomyces sp. NBC_01318]
MIDDEWRAEIAEWAERMTASRRKYREREAAENFKRAARTRAIGSPYAGMPADVVRGYQEAQRKREAAEDA